MRMGESTPKRGGYQPNESMPPNRIPPEHPARPHNYQASEWVPRIGYALAVLDQEIKMRKRVFHSQSQIRDMKVQEMERVKELICELHAAVKGR